MTKMSDEEYEALCKQYRAMFGKTYPMIWGSQETESERIAKMQKAIETGVPAKVPEVERTPGTLQ